MLTVHDLDPADAAPLFPGAPARVGLTPEQWDAYRTGGRVRALVAKEGGRPAGFAVAESHPEMVHVLAVEGGEGACGLLLGRLVQAAGGRDVSLWCPAERADLRRLLEGRGFALRWRSDLPSPSWCLYYLHPDAAP